MAIFDHCLAVTDSHLQDHTPITRRRSESAYIHQVNFLQLLCRVGEGDGAPFKLNLYLKTRFRNNRP